MFPEPPVPEARRAPKKPRSGAKKTRRWARRSSASNSPPDTGLYLAAVGRSINVSDAVNRPMFAMLMTEDVCWQCNLEEWRARRPPRYRRSAYAAWRSEGAVIEQKKARIRAIAADLRLIP
jgi:hypothetical protein